MSPLYCLLLSGDDNFKAQILFAGAGGKDGGRLGRASAPGLGFSLFSGEVCCVLGVSPYTLTTLPGRAEGSQVLPEASVGPPHPPCQVTWPRPAPSPPPLRLQGLGAETSSKEPALLTLFSQCLSLLI